MKLGGLLACAAHKTFLELRDGLKNIESAHCVQH
jgi:hypothetical protein